MKNFLLFYTLIWLALFSCSNAKNTAKLLEREDLFTLNYGNFEDELNLSKMDRASYSVANLCLNNGVFYISNPIGQKILKTSFYGDLLTIYYNPETNPRPSFYAHPNNSDKDEKAGTGTRSAIEYPFNTCSFIQVNSDEHLYVVDKVPNDRVQFDTEENIALTNVILHFDEKGQFIDYIGQEGLGGTPFPIITSLSTNRTGDIIAVCKTPNARKVFYFNSDGFLLYKVILNDKDLPFSYEASENFYANIDGIFPSYEGAELFIKIDYYVEHFDETTGASIGVNYDKSSIYKLRLSKGEFEHVQDVFAFVDMSDDKTSRIEKVYTLMNVCKDDWAFLMCQAKDKYSILLLNLKNSKSKNFELKLENMYSLYSTFSITNDFMLAGLFANEDSANISVWHIEDFMN